MNPLTTTSSQPVSHDWRRRSLVRVRRPAWAAQEPEAVPVREGQAALPDVSATKEHTTHNDIAW